MTSTAGSTPVLHSALERALSYSNRTCGFSPVDSSSNLTLASNASAASSSRRGSVTSSSPSSGSSRSSSPPTELEADEQGNPDASRLPAVTCSFTENESEAIAAIRARTGPSTVDQAVQPFLYLPALLSRLPLSGAERPWQPGSPGLDPSPTSYGFDASAHSIAGNAPSPKIDRPSSAAPVAYTASHLPAIDLVSQALHYALHCFRPVTPHYATSPYSEAFNWSRLRLANDPTGRVKRDAREWYIVAFRSRRKEGLPEDRATKLYEADRAAHEEAVTRGGLIMYWYGNPVPPAATPPSPQYDFDPADVGRNLATCIWRSRADAVAAMRGEHHKEAARLASSTYEYYTLERYVLRKEAGELSVRVYPWHGREVEGAA